MKGSTRAEDRELYKNAFLVLACLKAGHFPKVIAVLHLGRALGLLKPIARPIVETRC